MDYGYWSNNADGEWIPKPMDAVEGSTIGTHALKYSMNYFKPVTEVKALDGVLYQFVPSVDPSTLNVGDEFTVQLLNNGEPMADVDIIPDVLNHHTETIKTDENGMATVTASNGGVNVIGCEMVVPYENEGVDQKATRSKVFVSLSFTLYPERGGLIRSFRTPGRARPHCMCGRAADCPTLPSSVGFFIHSLSVVVENKKNFKNPVDKLLFLWYALSR